MTEYGDRPVASAHDRRHADPQVRAEDASILHPCRQAFHRLPGPFPGPGERGGLRRYQLEMRSSGASVTSMNAAVSALRFFIGVTLGRDDAQAGMTTVPQHHRNRSAHPTIDRQRATLKSP